MIIDINLIDIPGYFQESELYKSSISNGNKLEIDAKFAKFDDIITNIEELYHYLDTIQYWRFNKNNYPVEIYSILDTWSCIQHLFSITIKIKYPELTIIDEISFINNKRPMRTCKPKIVLKNGLSYLEGNELIEEAAEKGYFGLIKYSLKIGYILTDLVALKASEKGHIDILKFCFDNISSMKYIENRMEKSRYNNTVFKKVMFDNLQSKCYFNSICRNAAKNGHLECLTLAHQFGCLWDVRVCEDAALRGQYDCLKYAHENGCPWNINVCYYASQGHVKCLEYAHINGCPWDSKLYEHAIISGDIESIKYAHQNGCPWNNKICEDAALLNYFDILKYAIDNGALKNSKVCNKAASNGNFESLKYAHENGCDFDEDTCYEVNRSKNKECILYVHEKGCLCSMDNECLYYRTYKKSK
jgi:hypothetical protein